MEVTIQPGLASSSKMHRWLFALSHGAIPQPEIRAAAKISGRCSLDGHLRDARSAQATSVLDGFFASFQGFALATEFLGFTRQIMDSLERLVANDLPPEEAAELKLFRMVNVCVRKRAEGGETSALALDLLRQVMAAMKTGKRPPKMPSEWTDLADSEDAADQVREQSDKLWDLMRVQADVAVKNNHWTKRGPPLFFLVFALPLPLYYVADWLWRTWRAPKPEPETDAKKEKPAPKESKKQK
ncbi:unnamed protein product [Symbiodinium sp. CCMP2592]|nr:unnamed protein product [Symbiodinium sp. CCMP2592]